MDTFKSARIEELKQWVLDSKKYRDNYCKEPIFHPSAFWKKMNIFLKYIFDLSPENLENIRAHIGMGYFIGGPWYEDFFNGATILSDQDAELKSKLIEKYNKYTQGIPKNYTASEPKTNSEVSMIGINYKNKLINGDIVKEQACIANLYNLGLIGNSDKPMVIMEIGSGYGQLVWQLSQAQPNSTFIIVDYPETLFWSGTFLAINSKNESVHMWREGDDIDRLINDINCKFILIPNFAIQQMGSHRFVDLIVNQNSFQEMSDEQIQFYAAYLSSVLKGYIYSYNAEKQFMNKELISTVSELLNTKFTGSLTTGISGNKAVSFEKKYIYLGFPSHLKVPPARRLGASNKAWLSDNSIDFNYE